MGICRRSGSDGGRRSHTFTSPGPSDAPPLQPTPDPSGRCPPPPVPPGGRPPLRRRPHRRLPPRGPPRGQGGLEGPDLHPAGDPLGLPRPSPQRRPVLPRRGRPPDRASRRRRAAAVQLRDGGLLPGEEAPARAVLRRRGPPRRAEPGRAGRPAVAVEGPPRLPV